MIPNLPLAIPMLFCITVALSLFIFYKASGNSKESLRIVLVWIALQAVVSYSGFYTITNTLPPRFLFLILIPILTIVSLFIMPQGRAYLDTLDVKWLTILHVVRIPVELILFALAIHKKVPELMTFEGRNWDILSGISAPLIYYFAYSKRSISNGVVLIWNIAALALLINIVVIAILSAPTPFQKFAFDQPNIAVLHFPFTWLPCLIVPLVFFSHLVCIRKALQDWRS